MICATCEGKGFVPASLDGWQAAGPWNGQERRQSGRGLKNEDLKFREAEPAARFKSCPVCEGSGKTHPNLLTVH